MLIGSGTFLSGVAFAFFFIIGLMCFLVCKYELQHMHTHAPDEEAGPHVDQHT